MKRFSFIFMSVLAFITAAFMISCDTGLGEIVDIQAPEVSVSKMICKYIDENGEEQSDENTVFTSTIYTKKKVSFSGLAHDNVGVTDVQVSIKWDGESDYSFLKSAGLKNGEWIFDVEFKNEGACWLKIEAKDKKHNVSANSSKVINLFVDETAPVGTGWYIDRLVNGIRYNLQSKDKLTEILNSDRHLLDPQNKDVAQNIEFLICASFNDAAGIYKNKDENGNESNIPSTTITIHDVNGDKVAGPIAAEAGSGNYSPKFRINENVLRNFTSNTHHFFQVRYSSKDIVTVPQANEVTEKEVELGWFIWCPDSDKPRCSITGHDNEETINIFVGDALNITVFDDDGLAGSVEWYKGETKLGSKPITNGEREANIIIQSPDTPEKFTLKITAHDINSNDSKQLEYTKVVNVIDKFTPTLILTSPENNQIPSVVGAKADITFSGVTLDTSGCKYVEFVWVPDYVTKDYATKKDLAEDLLNSITHSDYAPAAGTKKKLTVFNAEFGGKFKGIKLWSAELKAKPSADKFKQHEFSFTVSLLNDFENPFITQEEIDEEGKVRFETTLEKCFFVRVTRDETASTDSELKLAADNLAPEIVPVNPSGNMAIIDEDEDFVIKFKAKKDNGLLMNTDKYEIKYLPYDKEDKEENYVVLDGNYDSSKDEYIGNKIYNTVLKQYTANNKNPKVILYAEDLLGNSASATYQAIVSTLPTIKTVTSSAPAKCKQGDEILINVSFSKAVTLSDTENVKLKLMNFGKTTADKAKIVYAPLASGNNSTTLVFKYTVKDGDISDRLEVFNESGKGPIKGIELTTAHVEVLDDENNLQIKREANPITIDGTAPKATEVEITTDAEAANKNGRITYLRAGKTITATVKTDKAVTIQGSPKFTLNNITLDWQSVSSAGKEIVFSKKISNETEGALSYTANCISGIDTIKDDFGNALVSSIAAADANIVIDTTKPVKPVTELLINNRIPGTNRCKDRAWFRITLANDATVKTTEYSTDAGSTWTTYTSGDPSVTETSTFVVRRTDWAGNVSDYSDPVTVEINSFFPDYTVECTRPDGRYKLGDKLTFKVYFANDVDIDSSSTAFISLSKNTEAESISSGAKATITSDSIGKNDVTEAIFEYTVRDGDDFTLKVAKDGVDLSGVKDKYGVVWSSAKQLSDVYTRADLHCDTVLPYVVSMTPQGTKSTQNSLNAYDNAKQIMITFNEPVSVVSGKIYLRQTAGWAIPPMFTSEEFSKVLAAVNGITVTESGKTLTGSQVLYMDGLEDAENLYGALVGPANDRYHGTAQYVGPYKKMTNGIIEDGTQKGNPDLSVKYVLDFGVDIWDKNNSTKQNFGKTFVPNYSKDSTTYTYMTYHKDNQKGWVNVITPETVITTDTIRNVLEQAHFHERYMNVNSTYVEVSEDKKTYTLNFPEGVLGESALPLGRQWELVIDKGAFMDETGNYFGAESDGTINKETTTYVLVKEGNSTDGYNNSFMSAGVEQPVIRVNRYSYGLGIKQPKMQNDNIVEEQIEILETTGAKWRAGEGLTTPSAQVQVKIDCESRAATVRYAMKTTTSSNSSTLTRIAGFGGDKLSSHVSTTTVNIPATATEAANAATGTTNGSAATKIVFLAGSGDYTKSCKAYITADATSTGAANSALAKEGVFQTVVDFNDPQNSGTKKICNAGDGIQAVNIHGTTGTGGVPSIAPFPLRDQPVSSAYMRQTYQKGDQYYWVSYEVLTQGIFSMYAYGACAAGSVYTNSSGRWYDWSPEYGTMLTGEFTRCDGMHSYTNDF